MDNILVKNLKLGKNVYISPKAKIRGINGEADTIEIGDHTFIGDDVQIICDNFSIGDYSKIHHHTNIHGYKACKIGHNAWIGQYSIIDSIGGVTIGNNCCIGANTHLWSHMKFGDTLEGCRFSHDRPLQIGNDVWFGGHCSVTPIIAEDKSMLLANSVITINMIGNHVYAGAPAIDISGKIGFQFKPITLQDKIEKMKKYLADLGGSVKNIKIVGSTKDIADDMNTYFCVEDRTYTKKSTPEEIAFMKFLLPEKGKFTPLEEE
jgi:acetyltransferase-like isoleucine patch superfamily enzyme